MRAPAIVLLVIGVGFAGLSIVALTISSQNPANSFSVADCMRNVPPGADPASVAGMCYGQAEAYNRGRNSFQAVQIGLIIVNIVFALVMIRFLRSNDPETLRKASIFALIPGISPGILLGIPFGIWALVAATRARGARPEDKPGA